METLLDLLMQPLEFLFGKPWIAPFVIFPIFIIGAVVLSSLAYRRVIPFWRAVDRRLSTIQKAEAGAKGPDATRKAFSEHYDEIVAAMLADDKEAGSLIQSWREFSETLVDETQTPIINTYRPVTFFGKAAPSQVRLIFWSNLFVGIGLVLTFLGLIVALYAAQKGMIGNDPAQMQGSLIELLRVAGAKFFASVAAVSMSVALRIVEYNISGNSKRLLNLLCASLERGLLYVPPQKIAIDQLAVLKEQRDQLKLFNTDFALQLSERIFAEDRFRRELAARPVYVLRDGEYVFIDPSLRPALSIVRKLQDSPENERRAFVLNPRGTLRERLQSSGDADSVPEELFIETEQFSKRVSGVDIWRAVVLPWIIPSSKNRWLPEKFGLKIDEDYYSIKAEQVIPLLERLEIANERGENHINVERILEATHENQAPPATIPLNSQSLLAIESLRPFSSGAEKDDERCGVSEAGSAFSYAEKLFLVVQENFEAVEFHALTEEQPGEISAPIDVPSRLTANLKTHQIDGFEWLARAYDRRKKGVLLADDMGLGKTLQAIALMARLKERMDVAAIAVAPMLIVAPTGLLGNWRDEILKHLQSPYLGKLGLTNRCGDRPRAIRVKARP